MADNILGGVGFKLTPLISFETILDLDFGLLNLVYDQYLDSSVFNKEFFIRDSLDSMIKDIYTRKEKNPLLLIAKKDNKKLYNDYYKEFLERKQEEICSYSITTNILDFVELCSSEQKEFDVSIVYYNEIQKEFLENDEDLSQYKAISFESLNKNNISSYGQLWVRDIETLAKYQDLLSVTSIYISSSSYNFGEDDFNDPDLINKLMKRGNTISAFDMYRF